MNYYTSIQLERLYRKAWGRMIEGDGYQPWGYDAVTIRATKPGWYRVLRSISKAHKNAIIFGKAPLTPDQTLDMPSKATN